MSGHDIDLDLPSGDRREQVIQHVYQKYGRLGAAMTANVITYRGRSAAREVGKALALDAGQIDRLAKVMHHFEYHDPHETLARNLETVGLSLDQPRIRTFADLWRQMQDLPRHLGQHSGGMVVSQGALDSVVPLEPASMPDRVVIQWDKDDCADMGIVKVDLLGLGMMAVLQDALTLINTTQIAAPVADGATHSPLLELATIPSEDPAVYDLLQKADTIGVFQVESRAQMATLPRMKPEKFYDLVVEVAIIRPGPIVGQMVHPYLNRRAGREAVVPLHPSLEPVLARTLGVPLFQEQLLRMAMVAANFTGGQAEDLRRAMGFKRSEKRMREIGTQLRAGMAQNGITGELAERIITSITSFALYGFPESHAASFALLAYASAYLKVHYPSAFYTALLNNQPMGFYHPATLVKDAQRRGVRFHPIDVQQSDWPCRVEEDGGIRLGFQYVSGLRKDMGQAMAASPQGDTGQHDCHAAHPRRRGYSKGRVYPVVSEGFPDPAPQRDRRRRLYVESGRTTPSLLQKVVTWRAERDKVWSKTADPIPTKRGQFLPLKYFPPDSSYAVPAELKLSDTRPVVELPTSTGELRRIQRVGSAGIHPPGAEAESRCAGAGRRAESVRCLSRSPISPPRQRPIRQGDTSTSIPQRPGSTQSTSTTPTTRRARTTRRIVPHPPPSNRLKVAVRAGEKAPGEPRK